MFESDSTLIHWKIMCTYISWWNCTFHCPGKLGKPRTLDVNHDHSEWLLNSVHRSWWGHLCRTLYRNGHRLVSNKNNILQIRVPQTCSYIPTLCEVNTFIHLYIYIYYAWKKFNTMLLKRFQDFNNNLILIIL